VSSAARWRAWRPGFRPTGRLPTLASGLLASLPDPALDIDDDDPDDQPVPIKGEPLSETILRERR
jgi:hypothetical protein